MKRDGKECEIKEKIMNYRKEKSHTEAGFDHEKLHRTTNHGGPDSYLQVPTHKFHFFLFLFNNFSKRFNNLRVKQFIYEVAEPETESKPNQTKPNSGRIG